MARAKHVAVLGAGIMGSSVALLLARRGVQVTLIDEAAEPFSGASRWNEGKIHLGYLYAGDPSFRTARSVLAGGLAFRPLVEELIGCSLDPVITPDDDIYLVHRESVVGADAMARYFAELTRIVREQPEAPRYLTDVSRGEMHRLTKHELQELTASPLVCEGYRVPERSVQTNWIADRFLDALRAEPCIRLVLSTRVRGVRTVGAAVDGPWRVEAGLDEPFDHVINALWHGRLAIDRTAGLEPEGAWSHRYRRSLFVRTGRRVDAPSVVLATGPFGDIKNYDGHTFYLSWYASGLAAEGNSIEPPPFRPLDAAEKQATAEELLAHLAEILPVVKTIAREAVETRLEGGWVFALGRGSLADPRSTLHQRDRFGIRRKGSYVSIDTGKYSSAPWLAREVCARLTEGAA